WGGSCFPKDTRALQAIADGVGYDFVILRAAIEQNARQLSRFAEAIERALPRAGTVALLGLAFKAGTPETRESPAVAPARRPRRARAGSRVRAEGRRLDASTGGRGRRGALRAGPRAPGACGRRARRGQPDRPGEPAARLLRVASARADRG